MAIQNRLTGRLRHRGQSRLFRKPLLVLQVEVHRTGYEVDSRGGSGLEWDHLVWRDATVEDSTELEDRARRESEEFKASMYQSRADMPGRD